MLTGRTRRRRAGGGGGGRGLRNGCFHFRGLSLFNREHEESGDNLGFQVSKRSDQNSGLSITSWPPRMDLSHQWCSQLLRGRQLRQGRDCHPVLYQRRCFHKLTTRHRKSRCRRKDPVFYPQGWSTLTKSPPEQRRTSALASNI